MNKKRMSLKLRWQGVCAVVLGLTAVGAWGAGIQSPLYVGNIEPVRDEYGREMMGSNRSSGAAERSRVEIRTATDGIIRPPSTDGNAHYKNPLLTAESVGGVGMNASRPNSGLFCMVFPNPPAPGTPVFARVFNAPMAKDASFYADSAITFVPVNDSSLTLVFGPAKPLDSGDADGDGLNNSWEKSLGIDDRLTSDYDGDGMSDLHEMLAGTAPDDPDSNLAFRSIRREDGVVTAGAGKSFNKPVHVKWQSVPGKTYRLEYVPKLVGDDPETGQPYAFELVGDSITAEAGEFEIDMLVDVPTNTLTGAFRVKLVK